MYAFIHQIALDETNWFLLILPRFSW
jgi:hypothetical protein